MAYRRLSRHLRSLVSAGILLCAGLCLGIGARAQTAEATVPAIFLSDIHLDPFHDPAKAQRLFTAPAEAWPAILSEPDSPNRTADFTALQKKCAMTGSDSSWSLLVSALKAAHQQAPNAQFVTVTGDFLSHKFDCHYKALMSHRTNADYHAFVTKTERVAAAELRREFPNVPIYASFGNNDSDCIDYHLEPGGSFLRDLAPIFLEDLARLSGRERTAALATFNARGDYSVTLPAPIEHTRLIVLNDIFLSASYRACHNRPDSAPGNAQIAWLRAQIADARSHNQQVWVMSHLPPGIDLYNTVLHATDVCAGQPPVTFLADDRLDEALLSGAGVIRLGLFAHTHMDEMRLLQPPSGPAANDIPIKMVSSISPINGNTPSFTTARVNPGTATLADYSVFTASNRAGIDATWKKAYTYSEAYHQPAFDGLSLDKLTAKFLADRQAGTPESQAYIRNYFAGLGSTLTPLWSAYVCVISHTTPQSYATCACQNK